ncbi:YveK family protein [Tuberibacillus sp. Marseille-P3662]|uniref:YveK family protein n=1 Tax=Tuberibacillus sp. Marseille-P3662 TaxID=1965358 RepID=UPI000A1C9723|nr:Wzz/FepE/Etk N-terminal domain-containing protein [Tuberibacillus sp. Marseille-P3662]
MEETISLREIFATLRKRLKLIVLITLVAVLVSAVATYFFMTPKYQASSQILVNQSSNQKQGLDMNQVQTNVKLINTYSVIVKSPKVLEQVIQDLDLDYTPSQLKSLLTVNSSQDSQVFNVAIEQQDPEQAAAIVNKVGEVFQAKIPQLLNVDNVNILSAAEVPDDPQPVSPKPMLNMAIAFVVGLMVSVGLAFLLEYMNTTIKTEEDIQEVLDTPVLGVVSRIGSQDLKQTQTLTQASQQSKRGEGFEA